MVAEQVYIFLGTVLVGAIMGVIFDFFRALRRNGDTRNMIVYFQDIVFWLIVAVIIITSSFLLNHGELRGYMLIGYVLGAFLYLLLFSRFVKAVFIFLMDLAHRGMQILCGPFLKLAEKLQEQRMLEKLQKKEKNLENKQEI